MFSVEIKVVGESPAPVLAALRMLVIAVGLLAGVGGLIVGYVFLRSLS